ncbi:TBC1 domain family member 15 [Elysia marginata]|uniref:TBC1 domain family member 15 n=1 Tax=Elysia marginata TaxID=1093978 RepID=A0AAV4ILZ8_9GAST|nr:TBC1 domain family member 15 [Elysia marginata]
MLSHDGSFEQVDIIPSKLPPAGIELNTDVLLTSRTDPLTRSQFQAMLDPDGRLISEHALRKAVFLGGVSPDIRKEVWSFLFGLYPCNSTTREREAILIDNIVHYHEMKTRWKTMLVVNSVPGSTPLEQGLYARYQFPEDPGPGCDHDSEAERKLKERLEPLVSGKRADQIDFESLGHPELQRQYSTPEMKQRIDFMRLQAQVQVNRERVDVTKLRSNMRVIDKDVPRTDRDQDYFRGKANPRLGQMREILLTFVSYHDQVGYAQGMNDILSRFLYVMGSEAETYWCFKTYMETIRNDFMEEGLTRKIDLVRMLLKEMDPALLKHLEIVDLGNLFFCHRWLLLGFKREFSYQDSLRCFEILSSHHLELSSLEAERALMREERKEFENTGGDTRNTGSSSTQKDYTFEVFMCATVLTECRDDFFLCTDCGQAFSYLNSLKFDLDSLLTKSERMFFVYCKKTVSDSFQIVETKEDLSHSSSKQNSWSLASIFR